VMVMRLGHSGKSWASGESERERRQSGAAAERHGVDSRVKQGKQKPTDACGASHRPRLGTQTMT
jgi:hypothetical protein